MQISSILVNLLNRFQPQAAVVMLVVAMIVGIATGIGVCLFRFLIGFMQNLYWHDLALKLNTINPWAIAIIPVLGGLVVSFLRIYIQQTEAGFSGLSNAVAKEGGRLPYAKIPLKTLAAAMSLGAGASLGPEGPSVELGSNIGSLLGQVLKFSSERIRLLVSAGAAAGLSAGFNAPIAGVFFALEVVLGGSLGAERSNLNNTITVVVIAAVVSGLVAQIGLGGEPAFNLPVYDVRGFWELPLYLGLGVLASFVAISFSKTLKISQDLFAGKIPRLAIVGEIPMPLKIVIGGLCVGLTATQLPEVMGIGYETVESILQDSPFSLWFRLLLLGAKLLLTGICFGSGFVGGTFAPAIFLGAILGSAYGQALGLIMPVTMPIAAPPAYALVGMAAVLAGTVRAPLTAVLLLFEMTRDYRIVLPLMAAVGLCAWMVEQIYPQQGKQVRAEADILQKIKIAEVMNSHPMSFRASMPVLQAAQVLTSGYFHSALVMDSSHQLVGIVTTQDIERNLSKRLNLMTVSEICSRDLLYTHADESLAEALRRMETRDLRQLPVVDRNITSRVLGIIERQAITTAYSTALTKQAIADKIAATKTELPNIIETEATSSMLTKDQVLRLTEQESIKSS
ncbi:chloride channel protein EriC [Synechococcus sp. PCC 7502]|uniref:chloride channel protein n=1 Tax=Synechococcus sp. PCC 7502 TaxID=1173263 RepID=UPI00029F9585|nr:chloride channel protein [Synechococcus sp. PCC 7502]AFY73933.1 chloride channel protein EriC [Synechococcus sp. PCC 7502]